MLDIKDIIIETEDYLELEPGVILKDGKGTKTTSFGRALAMYYSAKLLNLTHYHLSIMFNRDVKGVTHNCKKIEKIIVGSALDTQKSVIFNLYDVLTGELYNEQI